MYLRHRTNGVTFDLRLVARYTDLIKRHEESDPYGLENLRIANLSKFGGYRLPPESILL
jgi:hypothetical protein